MTTTTMKKPLRPIITEETRSEASRRFRESVRAIPVSPRETLEEMQVFYANEYERLEPCRGFRT